MVGVIGGYNLYSPAKQKNTNYNARTISNGNLTSTPPIHLRMVLRDGVSFQLLCEFGRRNNFASKRLGDGLDDRGLGVRFQARVTDSSLFHSDQTRCGTYSASYNMGYRGYSGSSVELTTQNGKAILTFTHTPW
jgi:hypothetical protein